MEAKRLLESQKIASASAQLAYSKNSGDLIGAAFSNSLFSMSAKSAQSEN